MRTTISLALLLALAAWFKFGMPMQTISYDATSEKLTEPPVGNRTVYNYTVTGVVRLLGADLYRPDGYFTATTYPLLKSTGSAVEAAIEAQKEPVGIRAKISTPVAAALGLEPQFDFWAQYGKWFLLLLVIAAFYVAR